MMEDRIHVLIVDDHRKTRKALIAYLAFAGNIRIVGEASNGEEAIVHIQKDPPHVVLMDLQMPGIDGFQATLVIKKKWPAVKVIALSQFPGYREAAMAAGVDYFLLKGDPKESILEIIDLVLHKRLKAEG
jgi:DNA-binding NarL/FixJ family response regulator